MNIYTIAVFLLIICVAKTSVVIDGEMTLEAQILVDKNGKYVKRQVLDETGQEKRKREEKERRSARKRKLVKEIYEVDQLESSKKDKLKEDDNRQELEERRNEKDKQRYVLKGNNDIKYIEGESHIAEENKTNGKNQIDQQEISKKMMTKAVQLECVYQYPERRQMEGLLSDMMNQLTRLIVSVHEYSESDVGNVRNMGDVGRVDDAGHADDVNDTRRVSEKRFRVVNDRGPAIFETIFKQLTLEYQNIYNTTLQNINRSQDPCEHQTEVRKMWQDLLAQSQHILRRSTLTAVELILPRNRADDSRHEEMRRMLGEELAKMRSEQLASLCDNFQLCYNDLL